MMRKSLFLLLFFVTLTFAKVSSEEILKKLNKIGHDVELMKQEMKLRFNSIDKRFEEMNKRFEMMQQNMDKRFEAMDKRFEMMQQNIDKRFEAVDKRFEILTNFMMALVAGIFGLIGFMMWDRRRVVEKAKRECAKEVKESEELNKKADKEYVDRLVKAMNELLVLKDETAITIFKKYGLL